MIHELVLNNDTTKKGRKALKQVPDQLLLVLTDLNPTTYTRRIVRLQAKSRQQRQSDAAACCAGSGGLPSH